MTEDDNLLDEQAGKAAPAEKKPSDANELPDKWPEVEAKTEPKPDQSHDEADDGDDDDDKEQDRPKKPSRYQRLKRSNDAMAAELADLRRRLEGGSQVDGDEVAKEVGEKPKESDFKDYFEWQDAVAEWRTRKVLVEDRLKQRNAARSEREAEARRDAQEAFDNQLERLADKVENFDEIMKKAAAIQTANHVQALVMESDSGALLFVHLAQNPDKVAALNRMSPVQAARELGRIEAGLALPNPKKSTKAPPPVGDLRGKAAPAPAIGKSMADYERWRNSET